MKPSPFLLNRARRLLPLTTKTAPRGFYKGTRTGSMGRHTRWGGYIVDFDKVRHYVVPEASADFKVCGITCGGAMMRDGERET